VELYLLGGNNSFVIMPQVEGSLSVINCLR
jgi:hypothetical protein